MIREAIPSDIPRMVDLGRVMHAESPRFNRMAFDGERAAATIARLIDMPEGFAWVYEDADGQVVGGLLGLVMPQWFSHELTACDIALFIEPAHRGSMAAVRLVNTYRAWAHDQGVEPGMVQIGILTGVEVEGTERLLQRLGWQRAGLVMEA